MTTVVIEPPDPLVSLELAKAHLVVQHNDDDTLISAYIAAASAHIDGPGGWLGRAIGVQTLEARFDSFPCDLIPLIYPQLIVIVSVKYDDDDGVEQTVDAANYSLDPRGALIAYGEAWPSARCRAGSVRVRYRSGYVENPEAVELVAAVPAPITAAVLLMVGDLYANRETVGEGRSAIPMSTTVEALLSPYRVWTL